MPREPVAVIYFESSTGEDMALDVASRVRNDGGQARPVWAHLFRQPEDMDGEASAVIIQASLANADFISQSYASFSAGVEIHYVDDEGIFIDQSGEAIDIAVTEENVQPETQQPTPEATDSAVQAEAGGGEAASQAETASAEDADTGAGEEPGDGGEPAS